MSDSPTCEFCEKKGLPIFPARFAIAPNSANAPRASGHMLSTGCGDSTGLIGLHAHYTIRTLRSGYLYMYNEALKKWSAWFVTDGGYFMPFEPTQCVAPGYLKGREPCSRAGHREIASCITITSPKLATDVWLSFSDVEWTPHVLELHEAAAYRARHMRKLNVPKLLAGRISADEPIKKITEIGRTVAEYSPESLDEGFAFSFAGWHARQDRTDGLVEAAESLNPGKGVVVALEDPAGMARDLTAMMHRAFDLFVVNHNYEHELATYSAIASIEKVVRQSASVREDIAAQELADDMSGPQVGPMGVVLPTKRMIEEAERMRYVSEADRKRVADKAWGRYSVKFDSDAMEAWKREYDAKLARFDLEHIVPLAREHVTWMRSRIMAETFQCQYDETDPESGLCYALNVGLCIGGTQDKGVCFDLYSEWLNGSVDDRRNLVLRALVLNHEHSASEIDKALKVSLDWRSFPFDAVVGAFKASTERTLAGDPDAVGRFLIAPLVGPIGRVLAEAADGKLRPAMVALGLHTEQMFITVEVTGSKKRFRSSLIRMLAKNSAQVPSRRKLEQAVAAELRRLEVNGVSLDGTQKKRFVLMVDPEHVDLPENATAQERARAMAARIQRPEDVEALRVTQWQEKVRNPLSTSLKRGLPYAGALIALVLQYNAMHKLIEDKDKSMSHAVKEANYRMMGGIAAFAGGIGETVGQGLKDAARVLPRLSRGFPQVLANVLKNGGRFFGVVGGLVMVGWDFAASVKAGTEGQVGLARAYAASGALGFVTIFVFLAGATGIGLLLVGAIMALSIWIEYTKDNKVQDWMERCVWGRGLEQRYATVKESMRELDVALQG
ncbi:T6SS effector BTH_I2691 family protein [Nitrogeniibacter aestuarii]|uniref:T6SS effector BTH_I2691 family protein n=1 Tax=Nitrogeniibacter aestuarii TaxID=2815343 RepID=UPI001D113C52|nr:T6SS effector BTH_I2691 family protein [Nitrogeniibacter aestuarii]